MKGQISLAFGKEKREGGFDPDALVEKEVGKWESRKVKVIDIEALTLWLGIQRYKSHHGQGSDNGRRLATLLCSPRPIG